MKSVYVVVLGDLGRSPRMRNHALSLANEGFAVTLLGYADSELCEQVSHHSRISIMSMQQFPPWITRNCPRLLCYILKVLWQTLFLFLALPFLTAPDFIVLQNPPTIPPLMVCYFYSLLHRQTRLILDWHNYGFSIMALALGHRHPLVRFAKFLEDFVGRRVQLSFCVSKAMKKDLEARLNVNSVVLYDRPPETFRPISGEERHQLFAKLAEYYPEALTEPSPEGRINKLSEITSDGQVILRPDRPAVLVSSTSWTDDEDFSILLDALLKYEVRCEDSHSQGIFPDLICIITGKGPMKEHYTQEIKKQTWNHVTFIMPWLEPEDYPRVLAAADLGVCLHTSSSGLDLPMKVVDMFGCCLPVAAKSFPALPELVKDGINGMIFDTSDELASQLCNWFQDFPNTHYERRRRPFCTHLERFGSDRWSTHWKTVALPFFLEDD